MDLSDVSLHPVAWVFVCECYHIENPKLLSLNNSRLLSPCLIFSDCEQFPLYLYGYLEYIYRVRLCPLSFLLCT
jgi:hypothetical protein